MKLPDSLSLEDDFMINEQTKGSTETIKYLHIAYLVSRLF